MNFQGDTNHSSVMPPLGRKWIEQMVRVVAAVAVFGALVGPIQGVTPAEAAAADNFSLAKTDNVGGEALIGEQITFTLEATGDHASAVPLYNLSFRDVLPIGVNFISASPAPTEVLIDVPAAGQTTVIWSNVSDLPANSRSSVAITVDTNPDFAGGTTGAETVPVGSLFANTAQAVASTDPFSIPEYSETTGSFSIAANEGSASASQNVEVIPFRITKTAPSELLRGVHGGATSGAIYTIEVQNNPDYATDAVTVVDVLHPGLEFLGCDTYYPADNTTGAEEWTGSGPVATGAGCSPTPLSVETADGVTSFAGSVPAAGSTVVTWDISNLAPGQVETITYRAGIPLFENQAFATPPTPASLNQGRNLDNNTGPSTGEQDRTANADPELLTASEPGLTNSATATGTYTPSGATATVTDVHTVESEDIIITKGMSGSLVQGTTVVSTLTITTSEYRDFTDLVVRDLLPSALCFAGGFDSDATPSGSDWNTNDCAGAGTIQSTINGTPVNVATVRELPSGGPYGSGRFEVIWDFAGARAALADLDADETLTIQYSATVRQFYRGGNAQLTSEPVLAGDSVSNEAEVSGPDAVSSSRPGLVADPADPDGGIDGDTASANISNGQPSIDKKVAVKTGPMSGAVTAATCNAEWASITWSDGDPTPEAGYGPGDIVCFELAATFPPNVDFEGVQIQDIMPTGYTYINGSAARVVAVDTIASTTVTESPQIVTFAVSGDGDVESTGNEFLWTVAARITDNADGAANDINANLMKLVNNNNGGVVFQLRDQATTAWTEPEARLGKGVEDVDGGTANGADFDDSLSGGSTAVDVTTGNVIGFRIDVWNEGNADATATEVQDILPAEFSCADVSAISDSGTCTAGVITWTGLTIAASTGVGDEVPDDVDSAPVTLRYDLTIPAGVDPSQTYTNTAGIARYQGVTNDAGTFDYFPADNIDPANSLLENTDAADDPAFLASPPPAIDKAQRSGINEAGNAQNPSLDSTDDEATIGEIIQYEITAVVPDGTTVYDAEIRDVLPSGLDYFAGLGLFDGTVADLQPTVTSTTGNTALTTGTLAESGGTVTYTLPTPYSNAAGSGDDSVTITFYAQVLDVVGNQADPTATRFDNRARFDWDDADGNDRPDVVSNRTRTQVVEPNPVIDKDHTIPVGSTSAPGDVITYRITVTNPDSANNVSVAHDLTIIDTVPVGLTPLGAGAAPVTADGDPVPSTGVTPAGAFDGVWSETDRTITWTPTQLTALDAIDPAGQVRFTYQAEVDDPAVASSSLTNTAAITAYSLDQDFTPTDDPNEADARAYIDSDDDTITVPLASIVKDIEPFNAGDPADDLSTATVGQPVEYEVAVSIPAGTAAYDATIFDQLPSRLDFDSFGSVDVSAGCEVLNSSTGNTTGVALTSGDIERINPVGGDASLASWFIGDVYSDGGCSITVQYITHVNTTAGAGDAVTNAAVLKWNDSDEITPDDPSDLPAGYDTPTSGSWTVDSGIDAETFTVAEPQLAIDKDVEDTAGTALVNPTCDTTPGNSGDADGTATDGCDTGSGEELRYTVAVTNTGSSDAHDVIFIDSVPVGLTPLLAPGGAQAASDGQTITGDSGSEGTWSQTDRTITWTIAGPLSISGATQTETVDYDAVVAAPDDLSRGEDLTNIADVDSYFAFSSAERSSITTTNPGNDDIVTYGNATGATRGSVVADEVSVEVHFPELGIVKTATTGQDINDVRFDESFSWTVVVTNTDAVASAFNVDLVDILPEGWTYDANSARITTPFVTNAAVEPTCSADAGSCGDPALANSETLTWVEVTSGSGQPLAPGETITLVLTATPRSAALAPDQATGESFTGPTNGHTNSASVAGEDATGSDSCCDPDGAGPGVPLPYTDTDSADVFVARADIEVDKAITPVEVDADAANGPYWFGSFVNYTITVDNQGPDDATGVEISDILDPTSLEFVSVVSVGQGTFDDTTNVWAVGDVDNGESSQIVLRTRLVGLGSVTNIAQNSASDQYDADSSPDNDIPAEDDQDSVSIEVVPTSLGDYIWLDLDGDGVQDGNESGIPGVQVDITWLDPATAAPQSYTTVTGTDGSYGVPLAVGLPAESNITVTVDVANSPNLAGLVPTFDRDGGLDHTAVDQITAGDQTLPGGELADLGYDFGYNAGTQTFGDRVWWDQDNSSDATDGVGEAGVPGVDVIATWFGFDGVFGTADDVVFTQTTDADGDYLFDEMPPGDFEVVVDDSTLPAGMDIQTYDLDGTTTPHSVEITLDPGEDQLDVDFSYRGDGSIGDTVWFDHDGDGAIDTGEPGIGGVTVTLDWAGPDGVAGNGDDVTITTVTAADGTYRFEQLPHGAYEITVDDSTLPGNVTQTFDNDGVGSAHISAATLTAIAPNDLAQDFGYRGNGSIGDTVFFDVDGAEADGEPDAGDAPIEDVDVIVVWAGADGVFGTADDYSFSDTTDASGNYLVTDLPFGDYTVTVDVADLPAGLTGPTYDADGVGTADTSITTLDGATPDDLDQNFAYSGATAGTIGDTVFFDANGDGIQDSDEVGFSGVDVTLIWFGPDGLEGTPDDVTQATTTDGDGLYLFDNLPEGDFRVTVDPATLPDGLSQTVDNDGIASIDTSLVTLDTASPSNLDQNFGYTGIGSIGDTVWLDLDDSGTPGIDAGEPGLQGVGIVIVWSNPQGVDQTFTLATGTDGSYLWPSAPFGDFTITIDTDTLPTALAQTFDSDGIGSVDTSFATLDALTPVDLDQDFSYRGTGSIGDTIWQDDDADGIIDPGEPLLGGVAVTIDYTSAENGATFTATTITASDGTYSFENLPTGGYVVTIDATSLPTDLVPVFDVDGVATPHTSSVQLADGENQTDVDFGYQPQTDISLDKSHLGDFALGRENTWTLEVSNLGPATAQAPIVVVDTLPAGLNFVRSEGDDWDCAASGQIITCTLVDNTNTATTLAPLASVSFDIIVTLQDSAVPSVTNTASVSTSSVDPNAANDVDSDPTDVPLAVLEIDKVADGDVDAGQNATYVLTARNTGPSATSGDVIITDALPNGLRFVRASTDIDGSGCAFADNVVTCTNPNVMTVDDSWTVRVEVFVTAAVGESVTNVGQVMGGNEVNGVDLPNAVLSSAQGTAAVTVQDAGILAFTGAELDSLARLASILLACGGVLVLLSRRKSELA